MKPQWIICLLISCMGLGNLHAQWSVELEAGGSNFLGGSINIRYDISISSNNKHIISPSAGVGLVSGYWFGSTGYIYHGGLDYAFNRWGVGAEASLFRHFNSSSGSVSEEMILFPHVQYAIVEREHLYFRASAGAYFAYYVAQPLDNSKIPVFKFEGDVIPGVGLTLGWKLYK